MVRWVVAGLGLLLAVACTDTNELEARSASSIGGRQVEVHAIIGGTWFPWPREDLVQRENGTWGEKNEEGEAGTGIGRFTLTISAEAYSYQLFVSAECYDLVRVGDPWPSNHDECR